MKNVIVEVLRYLYQVVMGNLTASDLLERLLLDENTDNIKA
jgi:hypothetical protein